MMQKEKQVPVNGLLILILVFVSTIAIADGFTGNGKWYRVLILSLPVLLVVIINTRRSNQHMPGNGKQNIGFNHHQTEQYAKDK